MTAGGWAASRPCNTNIVPVIASNNNEGTAEIAVTIVTRVVMRHQAPSIKCQLLARALSGPPRSTTSTINHNCHMPHRYAPGTMKNALAAVVPSMNTVAATSTAGNARKPEAKPAPAGTPPPVATA